MASTPNVQRRVLFAQRAPKTDNQLALVVARSLLIFLTVVILVLILILVIAVEFQ